MVSTVQEKFYLSKKECAQDGHWLSLKSGHEDVFDGLGKLDGKYTVLLDKSVKPVVHPPRRLPVAMTGNIQRKLEEVAAEDIIEKVNQPTDWVYSMLVMEDIKILSVLTTNNNSIRKNIGKCIHLVFKTRKKIIKT